MNKSVINAVLNLLTSTSFALALPFSANAIAINSDPITFSATDTTLTFPSDSADEDQISQANEEQLVADLVEVCDYYYDYYGNIYYYCEYYVY